MACKEAAIATRSIAVLIIVATLRAATSCIREQLQINQGFDAALRQVLVDVGQCLDVGEDSGSRNITHGMPNSALCEPKCVPSEYELQLYANRSGPFSSEVVAKCALSTSHCYGCERVSQNVTLFPGSPYEETFDRGKCVGKCEDSGESCVAVTNKFLSFENPNGATSVTKIERCGCADSKCYREDYFVSYWEEVAADAGKPAVVSLREKVINAGRCRGSCNGVFLPGRCYPSPSMCRLQVSGSQAACAPNASTIHSFTGVGGVLLEVASITTCSCMAA